MNKKNNTFCSKKWTFWSAGGIIPSTLGYGPAYYYPALTTSCFVLMPLHMQWQMVRSSEAPLTYMTLEWFGSRVFSNVSGQLIGSCKAPVARIPCATVRFLSRVYALMGFQVRAFGVRFLTTWGENITKMNSEMLVYKVLRKISTGNNYHLVEIFKTGISS